MYIMRTFSTLIILCVLARGVIGAPINEGSNAVISELPGQLGDDVMMVVVTTEIELQAAIKDNAIISIANDISLLKPIIIKNVVDVRILGNNFEVNGRHKFQCFYLSGSSSLLEVHDLVTRHCNEAQAGGSVQSTGGGAYYVQDGSLILRRCSMIDCIATGSMPFGGAIMVDFGHVRIYHSLIQDCTSSIGGGIASLFGHVKLYSSNVTNNVADYGGGISMFVAGYLTVNNSMVVDNYAFVYGGGVYGTTGAKLIINHTTFQNNSAELNGGGMSFQNSYAALTNCLFMNNIAFQSGGAIDTEDSQVLLQHVNHTTAFSFFSPSSSTIFSNNKAMVDGGAIFATSSGSSDQCRELTHLL